MGIALVFSAVALFSAARTISFAIFTARDKNYTGAVMLWVVAFLVLACAGFVIYRL